MIDIEITDLTPIGKVYQDGISDDAWTAWKVWMAYIYKRSLIAVKHLPDGRCAWVERLLGHYTIKICLIGDTVNVIERWCYTADPNNALNALNDWDGTGEPEGWHRHPNTARRRVNGDPRTEHIAR